MAKEREVFCRESDGLLHAAVDIDDRRTPAGANRRNGSQGPHEPEQ
jgi:hypothetical protein